MAQLTASSILINDVIMEVYDTGEGFEHCIGHAISRLVMTSHSFSLRHNTQPTILTETCNVLGIVGKFLLVFVS